MARETRCLNLFTYPSDAASMRRLRAPATAKTAALTAAPPPRESLHRPPRHYRANRYTDRSTTTAQTATPTAAPLPRKPLHRPQHHYRANRCTDRSTTTAQTAAPTAAPLPRKPLRRPQHRSTAAPSCASAGTRTQAATGNVAATTYAGFFALNWGLRLSRPLEHKEYRTHTTASAPELSCASLPSMLSRH